MTRMTQLRTFDVKTLTVSSPGTAVQGPDEEVEDGVKVSVRAHPDNSGKVYVANNASDAQNKGDNAEPLYAGGGFLIQIGNLSQIYVDADNASDKLILSYEE